MANPLILHAHPVLDAPQLVMGFSGWMDGGEVSTGAVEYLVESLDAQPLAAIAPDPFYIFNFPGNMELSSLFRPDACIEEGLVTEYEEPDNLFHYAQDANLILFSGKEPNIRWEAFANSVLELAETFGVRRIFFAGSVSGIVPHTRDVRLYGSVNRAGLRSLLESHKVRLANYEGPASFVTALMVRARERGIDLVSLVAEVPPYVQGRNFVCIEAVCARLGGMLGAGLDLKVLRAQAREFERQLDEMVRESRELRELLMRLEREYDDETRSETMNGLRNWFEKQDFQID